MSVIQNKLVPVDYDGNGTSDLGFFRPIFPDSPTGTLQGQLAVWLLSAPSGLPSTKSTVNGIFSYANGSPAVLGDGFIPGFSGPVNFFYSGPAPLFPDFNGDGKTDQIFGSLVYSNPLDDTTFQGYELATWFMNGAGVFSQQSILNSGGQAALVTEIWANPFLYNIGGQGPLGDFNGDGTTDLLFVRPGNTLGTEDIALWLIQNGTAVTQQTIGTTGVGWGLINTNDFNGNGTTDLLFAQDNGGATNLGIWLQNGTQSTSKAVIGTATAGWSVVDTNDFNGDGKADILFAQAGAGGTTDIAVWTLNGTQITGQAKVGNAAAGWSLVDHNDFNGDGKADLLFSRTVTEGKQYAVWLLNGTGAPIAQKAIGIATDGWTYEGSGDSNGDKIADLAFFNDTTKQIGGWLLGSSGQVTLQASLGEYDNATTPAGWLPPFTQPAFDTPPFPQPTVV